MSRRAELGELPIELDRREGVPLHQALHEALRAAVLTGRFGPGARLPSSRDLALQLGVSRGTVVAVYEKLASEGYLAARTGSGTRVAASLPDRWFKGGPPPSLAEAARRTDRRGVALSRWARDLRASPFASPPGAPRPFRAHLPAIDAFPAEAWGRLMGRRARHDERLLLSGGDARGHRPLREALAEHLRVSRGVASPRGPGSSAPSPAEASASAPRGAHRLRRAGTFVTPTSTCAPPPAFCASSWSSSSLTLAHA